MRNAKLQTPNLRETPKNKLQPTLIAPFSYWRLILSVSLELGAWWLVFTTSHSSAESLLLTGATVHTVSGDTVSPGQVWVKDGKIAAVGETVSAPGAEKIELGGHHLYPGIIALNTVLGLTEINAVRATQDTTESGDYTP